MQDSYIVGLFTLAGTALGALGAYAVAARTARIEEKRHFRELGLKVALTKFEKSMVMAQNLANVSGKVEYVPPFEAFVIDGVKLMELVSETNITASEMAKRLASLRDFNQVIVSSAAPKQ